jgi:hypothetical protein
MKRLLGTLVLAGAVTFGTASDAQAQFTFGPGVAYHDDADLGIGVWFASPLPSLHEQVSLTGSFIYFFPDGDRDLVGGNSFDVSYWELNPGLAYSFPTESSITPFVAAGLNIARWSVDVDGPLDDFIDLGYSSGTDIGLNVGGGIRTMLGDSFTGVAAGRLELGGGDGFVIEAGLGFPMGGGS